MAKVHYLGILLQEASLSDGGSTRGGPLGPFVPMSEPMPVGTILDVDGAPHRVTRVEEGVAPGCWLRSEGVPRAIVDDAVTIPTPTTVPEPTAPSAPEAVSEPGLSSPHDSSPSEVPAPDAPAAIEPETSSKKKRRRKTIVGR